VGSWILRRSLERWKDRDDPMVFALAEYNAGRSRALAWVDPQRPSSAEAFRKRITINSTRKYVESISARYRFYKSEEARSVWINWVLRLPPRRLAGMWNRLFTTATENGSDK
jgi:soluble lytic murein transglycosylase